MGSKAQTGHPCTQQAAEAANSKIKTDVRGQGPAKTHKMVAENLLKASVLWTSDIHEADRLAGSQASHS